MSQKEKIKRDYKITDIIEHMKSSGIDRRTFLMHVAMAGVAVSLPLTMCSRNKKKVLLSERDPAVLSEKEWNILIAVQEQLLPSEKDSPGAADVNAAAYVQWVLTDSELDPDERNFLKNGLTRLDNEADKRRNKPFLDMLPEERQDVLKHIETDSWGESWISVMLMYIFEALLSDPIYGANTNEVGWKWLSYIPGEPRPKLKYSEQLAVINKQ